MVNNAKGLSSLFQGKYKFSMYEKVIMINYSSDWVHFSFRMKSPYICVHQIQEYGQTIGSHNNF